MGMTVICWILSGMSRRWSRVPLEAKSLYTSKKMQIEQKIKKWKNKISHKIQMKNRNQI